MLRQLFVLLLIFFKTVVLSQNIIVKPYLQDLTNNDVKILWETDNVGFCFVDYGINVFDLSQTVPSSNQIGNGNTKIHTAVLSNLTPNQKYYYKVRTSTTQSLVYNFTTYKNQNEEQDINFIAVSDIQQQPSLPNIFKDIVDLGIIPVVDTSILHGVDNLHGVLIPGDLVQNGGNYQEWKNTFFYPAENISTKIPLYPVLGNHEYYNGGQLNYLKYFDFPSNGSGTHEDQWWAKDISNIRLIGLNSNSPTADQQTQLTWLQPKLDEACTNPNIDFVFVQLHHPFKSELWVPGELPFTGEVISKLESFTNACGKPSMHLFGHTHAYSRGQSKDHQHLWLNVAVAGGEIDHWGAYPNSDYPEFSISEDEYGFVLIETKAGQDPQFKIKRFSRGDDLVFKNNALTDNIIVKKNEFAPKKPMGLFPFAVISSNCVTLKASTFDDAGDTHQATQWQVSSTCSFINPQIDIWKQNTNWYNEVNTQANDDLTDQTINNLQPNSSYCWRVRYRDQYLKWSDWSAPINFTTASATNYPNLVLNNGAENGINSWTGNIESLMSDECGSVPVYQGSKFFAIGGVCVNEMPVGYGSQVIDLSAYAGAIDNGEYLIEYGATLRSYALNNDLPEIYLEFYNDVNALIGSSAVLSNNTPAWISLSNTVLIPATTRSLKIILKGTRLAGTDNDSYFDDIIVKLKDNRPCNSCFGIGKDQDNDGFCENLDCNDNSNTIYPGALEKCDGLDNNCDGINDTGSNAIWTGSGNDGDWHNALNWSQNMEPIECQNVDLNGTQTITITKNPVIRSLIVGSNATLIIMPNSQISVKTNGAGIPSIKVEGTLTNNGKIIVKP
jgi:acid phosphatase type 7